MVEGSQKGSIYDRIRWKGLLSVVWNSTPYPLRLFVLPYGLWIYRSFLKRTSNPQDLFILHSDEYLHSKIFRLFRPRYHKATRVLETYGVKEHSK